MVRTTSQAQYFSGEENVRGAIRTPFSRRVEQLRAFALDVVDDVELNIESDCSREIRLDVDGMGTED